MAYLKFKVQDNAYGNLLSGISASATTINLETGDGDRFPADNFVATFVEYTTTGDDTTPILGEEKVLVSVRSGDTLTVTRGYDGSTPRSFNAGDNIYLNVTSVIIEDIQDEVTRLETDKLDISDFNSTLRNNLGNWKVIYTNGTGDETELTLGSAGQFLKSNGATSAPTFESPTVDINGLTLDNDVLDNDDMLVYYDGANNKKRNAKASTSQEGLVEFATDGENDARTATDKAITPAQRALDVNLLTGTLTTTSSVTIAHGLGTPPRLIMMQVNNTNISVNNSTATGDATYDGTTIKQKVRDLDETTIYYDGIVRIGDYDGSTSSPIEFNMRAISAIDATNVTLAYTSNGNNSIGTPLYVMTVIA